MINLGSRTGLYARYTREINRLDDKLQIELIGDLATLLVFAGENEKGNKKPGSLGKPGRTKWLVAGACNRRYLHLDFAPIG